LLVGPRPIGALNLYATGAEAFTADSRAAAAQLTGLAAATVTAAMRHYDEATLTDHLRTELSSRSVIDQASGIIIGMQRCPPEMLRTVSQNRNVPLREIAADLVARTITTPPTETITGRWFSAARREVACSAGPSGKPASVLAHRRRMRCVVV